MTVDTSKDAVCRFTLSYNGGLQWEMTPSRNGDYVSAVDYDTLATQLAEAQAELAALKADEDEVVASVKPLEIAEQYVKDIIEIDFGDYEMTENKWHEDGPTEFMGHTIRQLKYHIRLNGMLVMHTDDKDNFLPLVQADYNRRILSAMTIRTADEVFNEGVEAVCRALCLDGTAPEISALKREG